MRKVVIPIALLWMLAACTTTAAIVAPVTCPPSLTQPLQSQPILPESASIPRPVDQADSDGLALTLDHMRKIAAWGRDGWARATTSKTYCEARR
jgi:hypothetical protein